MKYKSTIQEKLESMNNRCLPIPLTAVLLTAACTQLPTEPQPQSTDGHYTISIPALHQDSILFSYTVSSGTRFISFF
jgi:hypothetical protein